MITCLLHGELGNNLFQVAQTLAVAERNRYEVEFPLYRDCYVPTSQRPLEIPTMFTNTLQPYTSSEILLQKTNQPTRVLSLI